MRNYIIWKSEHSIDILVQVFNEYDLPSVQEQFAKEGYFIVETFVGKDRDYFFVIRRLENE